MEEITNATETTENAENENGGKKGFLNEKTIELLCAIFLGVTALLTAWASWIGSLHGGNQATNYTKSNNLAAEGNSEYNSALQTYLSDLMAWNEMMNYQIDIEICNLYEGREDEAAMIEAKLESYIEQNCSEILAEGFDEMTDDMESPFEVPGLVDKYFVTANELLAESQELLDQGQADNSNGDKFGLVTVIYSIVLFLLGIVGIFKNIPNRRVVLIVAVVGFVIATVYMFTIPMPTDFSFANYL